MADLRTNLVSNWRLEDLTDTVGTNTLTNNNAATFTSGLINNALTVVRASSQSLSITDGAQTGLGFTGNMTLNCWVKFTSTPTGGGFYTFIAKFDATNTRRCYQFGLSDNGGTLQIYIELGNGGASSTAKAVNWTPLTGTWYMVTAVYAAAAGTVQFYVNRTAQGALQTGLPTSIGTANTPFFLAASNSGGVPSNFMDGQIDECALWNKSLSAVEVSALYNGGIGWQYPFAFFTETQASGVDNVTVFGRKVTTLSETQGSLDAVTVRKFRFANQSKSSSSWSNQQKS